VCTFAGSIAAFILAETLLKKFTGKGIVDAAVIDQIDFRAAVALGASITVLIATRIGMPISTTHSLVGALIGSGLAAGSAIGYEKLGKGFFLPMLTSPVIAIIVAMVLYRMFRFCRIKMGVTAETCFCVGQEVHEAVPAIGMMSAMQKAESMSIEIGDKVSCEHRYNGRLLGTDAGHVLNGAHYLSSGIVSFARGLNDTPKIAALIFIAPVFGKFGSISSVSVLIALGGLIFAKRVADTMSNKITTMNHGQGFTANLVTGIVVIGASRMGLPVSTTHVSCGSLFGIGATTGQGNAAVIKQVIGAWILTLPMGLALGALSFSILQMMT